MIGKRYGKYVIDMKCVKCIKCVDGLKEGKV